MKLNEIRDNQGARHTTKRVGRGEGSGMGKTSTRGQKGLGARSGGKVMVGFEGGQNPLYKRLPMRGFNNFNFTTNYTTINVADLQRFVDAGRIDASKTITAEYLKEVKIINKILDGLKVLGNGEVTTALTIESTVASKSAIEKIEKAGGKLNLKEVVVHPARKVKTK
jgi:large subunit ribosomal protein L15